MTPISSAVCIFSLSVSFLVSSCPRIDNNKIASTIDSSTVVHADTAFGCEGTIYHALDTNSFLIVKFDADTLQLDLDYTFDLSDSNKLVEVYIDKYTEDGIMQSYCSDVIITNALVPTKFFAKSGLLKLKLSAQYADVSMQNLEFADPDGIKFTITNKRFVKVTMETGG